MQMNSSVTIERKRADCSALPKGWQREEVLHKSGISTGKVDVFYYSPTGKRIDSKPQLARHLGDVFDISSFDFQTGKIIQYHLPTPSISLYRCSSSTTSSANAIIPPIAPLEVTSLSSCNDILVNAGNCSNTLTAPSTNALKRKYRSQTLSPTSSVGNVTASSNVTGNSRQQQLDFSRALRPDISLVPPIRQTASIFKQPVTLIRNHENSKVKHDPKHGVQDKPKQLFWEKRLENLRACHSSTGEQFDSIVLPKGIRSIGPNVNEQTVLQSVATALHVLSAPVTGQTSTKTEFNKNATAFINPDQPLMQAVLISDDDIRRQEERVNTARRKLQEALKI